MKADVSLSDTGRPLTESQAQGPRTIVGNWSLRLRLSVFFAAFLVAAWFLAALFAWRENRSYIDKFFDTQQMEFAKMLLAVDMDAPPQRQRLPKTKDMFRGFDKSARGNQDKNALGFALFDKDGVLLLHDSEKGRYFTYDTRAQGFSDTVIEKGRTWRLVWLASPDGERIAAVGQDLRYRRKLALTILSRQMIPWAFLVPLLLAGLLWMLHRELAPLRKMSEQLKARSSQDSSPLEMAYIPSEVRPLVDSLNGLFRRVAGMRARERAFVADAAHELRTPLAGLRVQAQVAELSDEDPIARRHALKQMCVSLDRCERMVEQLLTLSRIEALSDGPTGDGREDGLPPFALLDWTALIEETLEEFRAEAKSKGLTIECDLKTVPAPSMGVPPLMAVLLRNLFDNAVKYTSEGGSIDITLDNRALIVANSGPGVSDVYLERLGERFFRPPGQEIPGSGLGLSIARQLAGIHGFTLNLNNRAKDLNGGSSVFMASLVFGLDIGGAVSTYPGPAPSDLQTGRGEARRVLLFR